MLVALDDLLQHMATDAAAVASLKAQSAPLRAEVARQARIIEQLNQLLRQKNEEMDALLQKEVGAARENSSVLALQSQAAAMRDENLRLKFDVSPLAFPPTRGLYSTTSTARLVLATSLSSAYTPPSCLLIVVVRLRPC